MLLAVRSILRRDLALFSLGFYCMVGGGMTPILAAGFKEVAADFNVSLPSVALTTGLYMMGLGLGSVFLSPTAILFGKRPVYLVAAICFIVTSIWCAVSPNFTSLVLARIFQGFSVSSVECLPSASVAEIFFLHEKAYRLGIYTLLLLGGKNLVPLISAVIIESLHWRWVFYIVAMIVGFGLCLLFFFVPETFWSRTPRPHRHLGRRPSLTQMFRSHSRASSPNARRKGNVFPETGKAGEDGTTIAERSASHRHAHFQINHDEEEPKRLETNEEPHDRSEIQDFGKSLIDQKKMDAAEPDTMKDVIEPVQPNPSSISEPEKLPRAEAVHSPAAVDYFNYPSQIHPDLEAATPSVLSPGAHSMVLETQRPLAKIKSPNAYTKFYQNQPPKTYLQQLKPWSGRLSHDNWFRVAVRPFILFAYPSILWSALVYSLSVGWLIVLSESVATIYQNRASYNFTALQTGLVYISPFVGGILGTVVAGKVSDIVVRALARLNGGIYEPEFRLVMGFPILIITTIGLMGYGWSAAERDAWIVPTLFFGFISFGCSVGSTTAITFAVDSYRQYAGEALVTLNFSKNIFDGLVFSLFFNKWLDADGSKSVFIWIGVIQVICLLTTIPMYIFGKRARMWTVRRNLMEKF